MYYCETSDRQICYPSPLSGRIKNLGLSWAGRLTAFLKELFTPEPSTAPDMTADQPQNHWLGAVKTLFWMTNAIAIGVVLANVCN